MYPLRTFRSETRASSGDGQAKREQSLAELKEHIHKYYIPLGRQFMVLFPEGGFLHKRREDIVCGTRPPCRTHLHYRLYPSSEVPTDTDGMTQWLYDRFIEKDKMLEEFYRTGQFPSKENGPQVVRQVRQDNVRYLILHLFFIASTFLQYRILCELWSYFW
ncbi:jg4557 [Pararge aegeria aegeria]|uniref:Jg4557 protein n=1 Tax=Pararge aegeria aegeria TaxID=348720 RepID=A0A8S4RQH7_9NEOP|nr:jg4557 [Pararge aegeria aegeria]